MATFAPSLLQTVRHGAMMGRRLTTPLHRRSLSTRCSLPSSLLGRGLPQISTRARSACACRGASRKKKAYIALGSNLGDRVAEIEKACNEMDLRGIRVKRTSSLWETEPMYVLDQGKFLNAACEVSCFLIFSFPSPFISPFQKSQTIFGFLQATNVS